MQRIRFAPCPAAIQQYVASIFHCDVGAGVSRAPALPGQVWVSASPVWWVPHAGTVPEPLPLAGLMGPSRGAHTLIAARPTAICGVSFTTLGWVELVREPADRLSNRIVDAALVWPQLVRTLLDAVLTAGTWQAQAAHLASFVGSLVAHTARSSEQPLLAAVDRWIASDCSPAVLCSRLGYCERQVVRITARTHGGPPRFLRLRHRALREASLLASEAQPTPDYGLYADQSHYTREFRRFLGTTPGAVLRGSGSTDILRAICAEERGPGSSHPLGLLAP